MSQAPYIKLNSASNLQTTDLDATALQAAVDSAVDARLATGLGNVLLTQSITIQDSGTGSSGMIRVAGGQTPVLQFSGDGGATWTTLGSGGSSAYDPIWHPGTAYAANDMVMYNGALYACVQATSAGVPGQSAAWRLASPGSIVWHVSTVQEFQAALQVPGEHVEIALHGTLSSPSMAATVRATTVVIRSDEGSSASIDSLTLTGTSGSRVYWHCSGTTTTWSSMSLAANGGLSLYISNLSVRGSLALTGNVIYRDVTGSVTGGTQQNWDIPGMDALVPRDLSTLGPLSVTGDTLLYGYAPNGSGGTVSLYSLMSGVAGTAIRAFRIDAVGSLASRPASPAAGYVYYAEDTGDLYIMGDGAWGPAVRIKGPEGPQGATGASGSDGVSPAVTVQQRQDGSGYTLSISDAAHPEGQTVVISNGADAPVYDFDVSVTDLDSGLPATASIVTNDNLRTHTLQLGIPAGPAGQDGADGVSPRITYTENDGEYTLTIQDADHVAGDELTITMHDGAEGPAGPAGAAGQSAYLYVAYAQDANGTNFSTTPTSALVYRAEIHTTSPVAQQNLQSAFADATWIRYIGDQQAGSGGEGAGTPGPAGPAGQDGITPHIGDNGHWYIGDTDTGVSAQGPQGQPGPAGQDGAGISIAGSVTNWSQLPPASSGIAAGSAYLNEADGKLYIFDGTGFPADGNGVEFKGDQGTPGRNGYTYVPSVAADGTLSWTVQEQTTAAAPSPASVNIKGPKGDTGAPGAAGVTPTIVDGYWIINGTSTGVRAQAVQANWTEADPTSPAFIQNKPELSTVATTGSYLDLTDRPTIPDPLPATGGGIREFDDSDLPLQLAAQDAGTLWRYTGTGRAYSPDELYTPYRSHAYTWTTASCTWPVYITECEDSDTNGPYQAVDGSTTGMNLVLTYCGRPVYMHPFEIEDRASYSAGDMVENAPSSRVLLYDGVVRNAWVVTDTINFDPRNRNGLGSTVYASGQLEDGASWYDSGALVHLDYDAAEGHYAEADVFDLLSLQEHAIVRSGVCGISGNISPERFDRLVLMAGLAGGLVLVGLDDMVTYFGFQVNEGRMYKLIGSTPHATIDYEALRHDSNHIVAFEYSGVKDYMSPSTKSGTSAYPHAGAASGPLASPPWPVNDATPSAYESTEMAIDVGAVGGMVQYLVKPAGSLAWNYEEWTYYGGGAGTEQHTSAPFSGHIAPVYGLRLAWGDPLPSEVSYRLDEIERGEGGGATSKINISTDTTLRVMPNSVFEWTPSANCTLFADPLAAGEAGTCELYLHLAAGVTLTTRDNVTLVKPLESGKLNYCLIKWRGSDVRLHVLEAYDET